MRISWAEIEQACRYLYEKVSKDFYPSQLVGIGHGGWVPSVILAQKFDCNIFAFNVKSYAYEKRERKSLRVVSVPSMENFRNEKTLIVDDICDSGATLKFMVEHPLLRDVPFKTAVIFKRTGSTYTPDFYWKELMTKEWVEFPWDMVLECYATER